MTDRYPGRGGRATYDRATAPPRPRSGGGGHRRADGPGHGREPGRAPGRGRARQVRRGRRVMRGLGIAVALVLLAAGGAAAWFYQHLNGNIRSVGINGGGGQEKADAFGRTPINILVIGSDGRNNKADCKLGGGCSQTGTQSGKNADVEMVVHISADRSNATVMSIPRDTVVDVPACTNSDTKMSTSGYHGLINSALTYGPACQVATVHQLTGIPIDHFAMLDFSGVVKMSDAVGGVSVCVSDNVYDTYSHLKLSKGTHTLKGVAALEFVRSRHGFGDGSDLGRTISQHIFLSAMLRNFKSAGTLTDPVKVGSLANAATKALTVDTGLDTVSKLIGLAADLDKVPAQRITFTTMQTMEDPNDPNHVVIAPAAKSLFATIANDQSLSASGKNSEKNSGKKASSASPSASASAPAAQIAVGVQNGTGAGGRASIIASALIAKGFSTGTTYGNAPAQTATTTLTYGPGQKAQAATVASALGLPASHLTQGTAAGLTLVIGSDWPSGAIYPGGSGSSSSATASADTHAAVADANAQTANESKTCAKVSPDQTVELNGVPMTPAQAYAEANDVPDSAS